jgi:sugar lactone lactonase YvrE
MSFFEVIDPIFAAYVLGNAPVKRLATGFDWVEGPVWFGDQNCLLFSDIPSNRIMSWSEDGVSAVELLQRPYAGQAGTADQLRARDAAGHADGVGRDHHCPRRQLSGQTPEQPE